MSASTAEEYLIMRRLLLTCGLIAMVLQAPSLASAQNRGNTGAGNSGTSGFGSTSSTAFGNAGSSGLAGSSAFGSSGESGFGSGSGSTGFGSLNGQNANGQMGLGGQNQLGANGSNGGLLGRNTNQNQFLGRNLQNQGTSGNTGLGGGRSDGRGSNGLNALNGGGGNGTTANQTPLVRPRQKVAFDYRLPTSDAIQTTLETRLTRLSVKAPGLKSVMVAVEEKGEVVLRGEVGSAAESKLAENMLRLEPGVRTVRNELAFPTSAILDE